MDYGQLSYKYHQKYPQWRYDTVLKIDDKWDGSKDRNFRPARMLQFDEAAVPREYCIGRTAWLFGDKNLAQTGSYRGPSDLSAHHSWAARLRPGLDLSGAYRCHARPAGQSNSRRKTWFSPIRFNRRQGWLLRNCSDYQRWNAGWPSFTATKVPRHVAQTFSFALKVPSTVARSLVASTTFADKKTGPFDGVGRNSLIA